eukprot:CAMPEP_0194231794 /NCGR_PEP_ID=MMETSP0158-20130606/398_1 /TAXON_ID=33649 /ORGANISM="Thalassionema nitzschioides, Strain L26-B" /LENGTH=234 /DNA_ID=CAMNT_0038964463 /DNA_START=76 /DNA_END=777 /DNA_ORIENTATION=+
MKLHLLYFTLAICQVSSFVVLPTSIHQYSVVGSSALTAADQWQGEVVSNEGGTIQGCSIQQVEESNTDWIITIDGVQADLGKFSEAIYRKLTMDAKKERFQGYRPGTIPPHLLTTYKAYTMDECARETVLEAMQQNEIRPFTDARNDFIIEDIRVPPPPVKKGKKKKGGKKKKNADGISPEEPVVEEVPEWMTYENMKGAIESGWQPGQSFSFVAKNAKGQKVLGKESDTKTNN